MTQQLTRTQQRWVERAAAKIPSLAKKMARLLPGVTPDELVSVGYEALTLAATRYDPDSGVPFAGYAYYRARGAMIDEARTRHPENRRYQRAVRTLETTQAVLEEAERRERAVSEADRRTLRERVAAAAALVEATAAAVLISHQDRVAADAVTDATTETEVLVESEDLRKKVQQAVAALPEADRELIEQVYFQGESMTAYGQRHGLARSTVSRRVARVVERLSVAICTPKAAASPRGPP